MPRASAATCKKVFILFEEVALKHRALGVGLCVHKALPPAGMVDAAQIEVSKHLVGKTHLRELLDSRVAQRLPAAFVRELR